MNRLRVFPAALVLVAVASACTEYDPTSPEESLAARVTPAVGSDVAVTIIGAAKSGRFGSTLAIGAARLFTDGSVSGFVKSPGGQGPIVHVEFFNEPNIWCLKSRDKRSGLRFTVLIRDIGDGVKTFDEFVTGGLGFFPNCLSLLPHLRTATSGDFKVRVSE